MIGRISRIGVRCVFALLCFGGYAAHAEPYLAVQFGLKCNVCHVNPTGGGLRSTVGDVLAQTAIPSAHLDTGGDNWTGALGQYFRVGGDLRCSSDSSPAYTLGAGILARTDASLSGSECDPRPADRVRR